jgi:hypothetical protein
MPASLHHAPTRSTLQSASLPKSKAHHMMDDAAAREVHLIADRLADTRDVLRDAINYLSRSTYVEAGSRDRKLAEELVQQAWRELAGAARSLAEPAPRFRRDSTGPRPVVRRRLHAVAS